MKRIKHDDLKELVLFSGGGSVQNFSPTVGSKCSKSEDFAPLVEIQKYAAVCSTRLYWKCLKKKYDAKFD